MGKLNCTKSDAKAAEKVSAGQFDSTCGTRSSADESCGILFFVPWHCILLDSARHMHASVHFVTHFPLKMEL